MNECCRFIRMLLFEISLIIFLHIMLIFAFMFKQFVLFDEDNASFFIFFYIVSFRNIWWGSPPVSTREVSSSWLIRREWKLIQWYINAVGISTAERLINEIDNFFTLNFWWTKKIIDIIFNDNLKSSHFTKSAGFSALKYVIWRK